MSIRVYLKKTISQAVGYRTGDIGEGKYFVGSFRLWNDVGTLYFDLPSHNDNVAEFFAEYVEKLTLREIMFGGVKRETGIYQHKSAKAELSFDMLGGERITRIAIEAKKLEDLREILVRIQAGEIRPVQSYEGPQDGMSAEEKAAELNRLNNELARVEKALKDSCREIVKQKEATAEAEEMAEATKIRLAAIFRKLIDWRCLKLRASILPLQRTKSVIKEIDDILLV